MSVHSLTFRGSADNPDSWPNEMQNDLRLLHRIPTLECYARSLELL